MNYRKIISKNKHQVRESARFFHLIMKVLTLYHKYSLFSKYLPESMDRIDGINRKETVDTVASVPETPQSRQYISTVKQKVSGILEYLNIGLVPNM